MASDEMDVGVSLINKIRELEAHLEAQRQIQQTETPARLLWMSCQSLLDRLRHAPPEPIEKDPAYDLLKQYAADQNPLAISIVDSLPAEALKVGVQSEQSLSERFNKVNNVCKRVALVDSHGGGLGKYLLSYMQSMLIFDKHESFEDEIKGKKLVDPTKWTTHDILARVRYSLSNHDLEQAIRYANQLKGQPRVVARDWVKDARSHLATRQAFGALSTHAVAIAVESVMNNSPRDYQSSQD
uniref:MICOS complex subunit MIC60 n=1 Tax=Aceria tosichella TaxID=561515 RepID=A0A6G1S5A2_9ACAR